MRLLSRPSFPGRAILPDYEQDTAHKPIEIAPVPEQLVVHLVQHPGLPNEQLVEAGDHVKVGQKIGDSQALGSAGIHAPATGRIASVERRLSITGHEIYSIIIDVEETCSFPLTQERDLSGLSPYDISAYLQEVGIAGIAKKTDKQDKATLIINGCEFEPYLAGDERIMTERPQDVIAGARLIAKAAGVDKVVIAIKANKPKVISAITLAIDNNPDFRTATLPIGYPQGLERQLASALSCFSLKEAHSVAVHDPGACIAVLEALKWGKPLIERVITLGGPGLAESKNYLARVGTPIAFLVEAAGGLSGHAVKVIAGGPMTGYALHDLSVPTDKSTKGIIALDERSISTGAQMCVSCGRCIETCPARLMPNFLSLYGERDVFDEAGISGIEECIECGLCAYVCPSKRPIVQHIKFLKSRIGSKKAQDPHE